ncbi:hypothetical protein V6N13_111679 [Hibiscus sabdariffa]|uniref:GDSL esterase/lipase n=1 Tax=Hibiscus sabdariffa TaxID=183260 RepID=A0ABR2TL00_9ROSI
MAKRYVSCFLGVFVLIAVTSLLLQVEAPPPPAAYIFGDSTLDVGTNDFIPGCLTRSDFYFNGIDFPRSKPTGRFSNGLNTADQIAILLGQKKSPPPFLYLLKHPAEYTAACRVPTLPPEDPIKQFSTVRSNITPMTGSEEATENILSKAFFLISTGVGSNDIFEYLLNPTPPMSVPEFNDTLISTYEYHIKTLYELGARTFGILTVPPIGCTPFARAVFTSNNSCFEQAQEFLLDFSLDVAILLENFSSQVFSGKYLFDESFFDGRHVGTYDCNQTASFCSNRDEYLFWDRFHPSQRASELAALTLFGASVQNHSHEFQSVVGS